ncbi:hypothetical protein M514_19614, partial [Trichuris suis]
DAHITNRGRPSILDPQIAMENALQASAVVEHAVHCDKTLQRRVLCYESNLRSRRIKEALYTRHNSTYNGDQGAGRSNTWSNI